jgi:DnaJ-domain-containing protein 1
MWRSDRALVTGPHSNLIFLQLPKPVDERTGNRKMSDQPLTMERAYRVLNIAPNASALAIKQAYRKLLKRWHPDLQQAGTTAHAESTEMSRRINEAYALIQHAPLRYERFASAKNTGPQPKQTESTAWQDFILRQAMRSHVKTPQRMDRVEFWVRFVCGAIFGGGAAFVLSLDVLSDPRMHTYPDGAPHREFPFRIRPRRRKEQIQPYRCRNRRDFHSTMRCAFSSGLRNPGRLVEVRK